MTKLSRRWVLKGLGASVAIPALPSLLGASDADAQAMMAPRYFVNLGTAHGATWERNMLPAQPAAGVTRQMYGGREIRSFALTQAMGGGEASVSPVLSADQSRFTPALKNKMFIARGLDVPWYIAHNSGGHLGNFAANDGNGADGRVAQMNAQRATIDQLMAWSSSFYPDLAGLRDRVLVLSGSISYGWQNPATRTGAIQGVGAPANTPNDWFNRLFPSTGGQARAPIVDKVMENYRRLRANPRLSSVDRDRLDDHIQRLSELQRRVNVVTACTVPPAPPTRYQYVSQSNLVYTAPYARTPSEQTAWFRVMNDLLVAAFTCNLSRIAVSLIQPNLSDWAGDWHQEVAHQAETQARQDVLWPSYKTFFKDVLLDLAIKLDGVNLGTGKTLLDQSMVVWTQESGPRTHDFRDSVVVGFGSAGGRLNTGIAVDYRNLNQRFEGANAVNVITHPGLLWHQWLGTVLQTMGIPKAEWEVAATNGGYPDYNFSSNPMLGGSPAYPPAVWQVAGDRLPFLSV